MKKYISVLAILLAVTLFPISFSGSQTSSASDSLYLVAMEGGTITVSANPVNIKTTNTNIVIEVTYQWTIDNEICDAATAAKYGVEFSGGTTSTLTISNINGKLNNKTLICNCYLYNKSFGRVCTRILQVVAYKPTAP